MKPSRKLKPWQSATADLLPWASTPARASEEYKAREMGARIFVRRRQNPTPQSTGMTLMTLSAINPVLVQHRGGHTAFVNSRALELAKITDQTPDSPGGRFEHDGEGHLTGFVGDAAMRVFMNLIPQMNTRDDYRQGTALIAKLFTSKGITSACDADASPEDVEGYQDARDTGELTMRVYCHVSANSLDRFMAAGIHAGFGDEWVRIGGVKQYADGSISERTAWLSRPYIGIANNYVGLQ